MKKRSSTETKCSDNQRRHLLGRVDMLCRRDTKPPKPTAKEYALAKRHEDLMKQLADLDDKIEPFRERSSAYEQSLQKKVNARAADVRTSIYFKSADEALKAVEALFFEFDSLLED